MKAVIFDLGGTLMEYKVMPYSWMNYYAKGFEAVNAKFDLNLSQDDIQKSCEVLKSKNAGRVSALINSGEAKAKSYGQDYNIASLSELEALFFAE